MGCDTMSMLTQKVTIHDPSVVPSHSFGLSALFLFQHEESGRIALQIRPYLSGDNHDRSRQSPAALNHE